MHNLKNRIALVYVVTTGILLGVVYFAIYFIASGVLFNDYDRDLRSEFHEVTSDMLIEDGQVFAWTHEEWEEHEHGEATLSPVFLQALDSTGRVLRVTPNLRDSRLEFQSERLDTFLESTQLDGNPVRYIQGPVYDSLGRHQGYLIVGKEMVEGMRLLSALRSIMLLSFPVVLGLIVVISRAFGTTIVRPVSILMETVDRITRENLDERVPLPTRNDELRRLSTTVNNLLDRLQELIVREQTFAADAAHELRTPLAVLKGTLEVLIRQPREPRHYEEKLQGCIAEIDRIGRLVDQLLLIAKYEVRGADIRWTEVDVGQSLAGALERLSATARSKQTSFQLTIDDTAAAQSDPLLLGTILENILSNAIKYSPADSPIEVRLSQSSDSVDVSIKDHGPGLTEQQAEKVFKRFYRTDDDPAHDASGFGLGLALVRRLSDLLGVKVALETSPGHGSKFSLSFPLRKPTSPARE